MKNRNVIDATLIKTSVDNIEYIPRSATTTMKTLITERKNLSLEPLIIAALLFNQH